MIHSYGKPVGPVVFPEFKGTQIHMRPIEMGKDIPEHYVPIVSAMLRGAAPVIERLHGGRAAAQWFLTIDERDIPVGQCHRRGGVHYDGVYLYTQDKDPRWNTMSDLRAMARGGIVLAASAVGGRCWNGTLYGEAGPGGDCEHLRDQLKELTEFDLEPNVIYTGNAMFLHESIPVVEDTRRQLVRLTYTL